jgi:hypothetical protein
MSDSVHFALFFAGILLITGALIVGVGVFEYEVTSLGTVEQLPEDTDSLVSYAALSTRDRRTVDRALAGERLVVRDPKELPGQRKTKEKLAVRRGDETYLLARRIFFNWRTEFGTAAVAMAAAGFVAISEAVRRRHFPHRPAYWVSR